MSRVSLKGSMLVASSSRASAASVAMAEKMRRQNLATASLAVWVQTNSFKPDERQYSA